MSKLYQQLIIYHVDVNLWKARFGWRRREKSLMKASTQNERVCIVQCTTFIENVFTYLKLVCVCVLYITLAFQSKKSFSLRSNIFIHTTFIRKFLQEYQSYVKTYLLLVLSFLFTPNDYFLLMNVWQDSWFVIFLREWKKNANQLFKPA